MARAQRISHHILTRRRGVDFGGVGEAADDGHAGEGEAGGRVEGAVQGWEREEGGGMGEGAEGGAEVGEEGHCCCCFVGVWMCGWVVV